MIISHLPNPLTNSFDPPFWGDVPGERRMVVMQPSLLVVEDDDTIRDTVREALDLEGFRVTACGNGLEALDPPGCQQQ